MATFTRADVERLARLARLELSEEEQDLFARQLSGILAYAEQVQRADTSGVDPRPIRSRRPGADARGRLRPSLDRTSSRRPGRVSRPDSKSTWVLCDRRPANVEAIRPRWRRASSRRSRSAVPAVNRGARRLAPRVTIQPARLARAAAVDADRGRQPAPPGVPTRSGQHLRPRARTASRILKDLSAPTTPRS